MPKNNKNNAKGKGKGKKPGCWNCGSMEHFSFRCPNPLNSAMAAVGEWGYFENWFGNEMPCTDYEDDEEAESEAESTAWSMIPDNQAT